MDRAPRDEKWILALIPYQKLSPIDKILVNENLVYSKGVSLGNKLLSRVDCMLCRR